METHLLVELVYFLNQKNNYRAELKKLRKDKKRDYLTEVAIKWNLDLMKNTSAQAWTILQRFKNVYGKHPKQIIRTALEDHNSI